MPAKALGPKAAEDKPVPKGSTLVNAGSNFFAADAPFGSGTSRFSPSMSMAHHLAGAAGAKTSGSGTTKANRKFVPPALRTVQESSTSPDKQDAGKSGTAEPPASTTYSSFSSGSRRAERPRSAVKDEQARSRALRAEITAMREQKLQAMRDGHDGGGLTPRAAAGTHVVRLETLTAGAAQSLDGPRGRIVKIQTMADGEAGIGPAAPCMREISTEYASLLEFVAGEARSR